jgi:GNAT superfamily N-acetyltransferase
MEMKSGLCGGHAGVLNRGMIDMLVRLYDLPDAAGIYRGVEQQGLVLRRARAFETHTVAAFVREHFSCYDTTLRGFFGPTGVAEDARGLGLGKALLMKSLEALRETGYAYAIIGGVGPKEFYAKACGAIEIPGSDPGVYTDLLP